MNRARRAGMVLGCAAVLTLAAGAPARAASVPEFQIVTSVHYGQAGNASGYSAVIALGPGDAWVFGGTNPGGASSPKAEHWDGLRWRASALPAGLGGFIVAADASSPSNVWAVGNGYALRWNGGRWTVAGTFGGGEVTSVVAVGHNGAWVFGPADRDGEAGVGAWHYDGHTWVRVAGLAATIYRASAVSAQDIWAITTGPGGSSLARYDGTGWDLVPVTGQALNNVQLGDIVTESASSVWVSGIADGSSSQVVLAHWNGSTWTRFTAPWPAQQAERFAPDGSGGIWIPTVTAGTSPQTWILHLSSSGQWTRMEIATTPGNGVGVGDLALIPCTQSLWGAGGLVTTAGGNAVILGGDTSELLTAHRFGFVTSGTGCAPARQLPAPAQGHQHRAVPRYAASPRSGPGFPPGAA
jgi:hypothetical protein